MIATGESPYQSIIDETLSEIETRRGYQDLYSDILRSVRERHQAAARLPHVLYAAFCQQWIAVAWFMLIGRES